MFKKIKFSPVVLIIGFAGGYVLAKKVLDERKVNNQVNDFIDANPNIF